MSIINVKFKKVLALIHHKTNCIQSAVRREFIKVYTIILETAFIPRFKARKRRENRRNITMTECISLKDMKHRM